MYDRLQILQNRWNCKGSPNGGHALVPNYAPAGIMAQLVPTRLERVDLEANEGLKGIVKAASEMEALEMLIFFDRIKFSKYEPDSDDLLKPRMDFSGYTLIDFYVK